MLVACRVALPGAAAAVGRSGMRGHEGGTRDASELACDLHTVEAAGTCTGSCRLPMTHPGMVVVDGHAFAEEVDLRSRRHRPHLVSAAVVAAAAAGSVGAVGTEDGSAR